MKLRTKINKISRKIHDQAALWASVPIVVIIVTGILLQVKKEFAWIQPPTQKATPYVLNLGPDEILASAMKSAEAKVESWKDIDRLDLRPKKGIVKVRTHDRWEIQIDMGTGAILHEAYRRSDLIESIHDGSFFHPLARLWVFLPVAVVLLLLWITGVMIFTNSIINRRNSKLAKAGKQ